MINYNSRAHYDNLRALYEIDPNNGFDWYVRAHSFAANLAEFHGIPLQQVCGILAALSANTGWKANKDMLEAYLDGHTIKHFPLVLIKCLRIEQTEDVDIIWGILNGNKIQRFFWNILHPWDDYKVSTIDRHIYSGVITGKVGQSVKVNSTDKRYLFVQDLINEISEEENKLPQQTQAIIWCNFKNIPGYE